MQNFPFNLGGSSSGNFVGGRGESRNTNAGDLNNAETEQLLMDQLNRQARADLLIEELTQGNYLSSLLASQQRQQQLAADPRASLYTSNGSTTSLNSIGDATSSLYAASANQFLDLNLPGQAGAAQGYLRSGAVAPMINRDAILGDLLSQQTLLQRLQHQQDRQQRAAAHLLLPTTWRNESGSSLNATIVDDPYGGGLLAPWSATSAGVLGKIARSETQSKLKKRVVRKKSKDKPKRPLSAYNIFFKDERARILSEIPGKGGKKAAAVKATEGASEEASGTQQQDVSASASITTPASSSGRRKSPHGKIGFENLAKAIAARWQSLDPEMAVYYKGRAAEDMARYKQEMATFHKKQAAKEEAAAAAAAASKADKEADSDS